MPRTHQKIVIAHHLIFPSYAFWLANDPRGSGSSHLRQPKFEELGPIHPGRKSEQPTRATLRAFYEQATPLLQHEPIWFNENIRNIIAASFAQTTKQFRYTVWSFAILSNHAHLCLRQHRDHYQTIWTNYAENSRDVASTSNAIPANHPLWANRPYSVYLYTSDDIRRTNNYIQQNPEKENLPPQTYDWLQPYTGWPFPNPHI
jgi:hypothetical protein